MDLKINQPNLNIEKIITSSNEKKNIEIIYKEIKKEKEVIEIEDEKNKKYKSLKEGLKSHESPFSSFRGNAQKSIRKMLREQSGKTKPIAQIRVKRFSVIEDSKELNILKKIRKIKKEEKRAIVEFYKSYFKSIQDKENLLNRLESVSGSELKRRRIRDTNSFENNLYYLDKIKWPNSEIDLLSNNAEVPPEALLSKKLSQLMKDKFKELEQEIQEVGYQGASALGYFACSIFYAPTLLINKQSPCASKIAWLRENQETLNTAVEFTMLLGLLKEMKRSPTQSFQILYDES